MGFQCHRPSLSEPIQRFERSVSATATKLAKDLVKRTADPQSDGPSVKKARSEEVIELEPVLEAKSHELESETVESEPNTPDVSFESQSEKTLETGQISKPDGVRIKKREHPG